MYMTIYTSKIKKKILNKFHILVRFAYTSKFMTQTTLSELSVMRVFWFWVYIFVFFLRNITRSFARSHRKII